MTASPTRSDGSFSVESQPLRDGTLLALRGELDLATVPALEQELRRAELSGRLVAVDLSGLSFIDSTGLHALISAEQRARRAGSRLVLVQGPPQVRRLLELTGANGQLQIVPDASTLPA